MSIDRGADKFRYLLYVYILILLNGMSAGVEFDAPLFLDCCGLVRRVLRDLHHDFGFRIGPWNQAYMVYTHTS